MYYITLLWTCISIFVYHKSPVASVGAANQHSHKNYIKIIKQKKPEASIILEDVMNQLQLNLMHNNSEKERKTWEQKHKNLN